MDPRSDTRGRPWGRHTQEEQQMAVSCRLFEKSKMSRWTWEWAAPHLRQLLKISLHGLRSRFSLHWSAKTSAMSTCWGDCINTKSHTHNAFSYCIPVTGFILTTRVSFISCCEKTKHTQTHFSYFLQNRWRNPLVWRGTSWLSSPLGFSSFRQVSPHSPPEPRQHEIVNDRAHNRDFRN